MIVTTTNVPPAIQQYFNRFLLDFLYGLLYKLENEILPRSLKKIRPQDTGKRKLFNLLYKEFYEVYERKKIEEAEYKEKVSKAAQKVPRIPTTGGIARFKRFQPEATVS